MAHHLQQRERKELIIQAAESHSPEAILVRAGEENRIRRAPHPRWGLPP